MSLCSNEYEYEMCFRRLYISDEAEVSEKQLNGFIIWFIDTCKEEKVLGRDLWEAFRENFEGWTSDIFVMAAPLALNDLRAHLRRSGIFIPRYRGTRIENELAKVVREKEQPQWTFEVADENLVEPDESSLRPASPVWSVSYNLNEEPSREIITPNDNVEFKYCVGSPPANLCSTFMDEPNQQPRSWREINEQIERDIRDGGRI